MSWHTNKALARLITQYRERNAGSEVVYTIADDAHSSTCDHAVDPDGTVDAGDFMSGPTVSDAELDEFAETLRLNRDPRIKYVIRRQRIFAGNSGPSPWVWRTYSGKYHGHTHVSTLEKNEDDGSDWKLSRGTPPRKVTMMQFAVKLPELKEGDDDSKLDGYNMIARLQRLVGFTGKDVDGIWGPNTSKKFGTKKLTEADYRRIMGLSK